MQWIDLLNAEIPKLSGDTMHLGFSELGLDSFDLLTLRLSLEQRIGAPIPDAIWTALLTPAEAISAAELIQSRQGQLGGSGAHSLERSHLVGMPQMALNGLSESWLFKELGDMHWDLITTGLGTTSSQLVDGQGDRLYATFTRIRIVASRPLSNVRENDKLDFAGTISRCGAGIFLGGYEATTQETAISATVMSSFSKRGTAGRNTGLLRGQPDIPPSCPIPELESRPFFLQEYQNERKHARSEGIFNCTYRLNPYHDINGVGLLYFAAYPIISDMCELNYRDHGNAWAAKTTTIERDIYYFANSDVDETIRYEVLADELSEESYTITSLLSRMSDGAPMAYIATRKLLR